MAVIGHSFNSTYSISYCKDNIKCDSTSYAPKYPLNNGVPIVPKLVELSNTSDNVFTTKSCRHDIAEIFLKVALKIIQVLETSTN